MGAEEPTTESLQAAYMLEPGLWNADASGLRQVYALGYAAARAERDHISRLHEIATENAARYSAVIEKAKAEARDWQQSPKGAIAPTRGVGDIFAAILDVDADAVLRERDAAIERKTVERVFEILEGQVIGLDSKLDNWTLHAPSWAVRRELFGEGDDA